MYEVTIAIPVYNVAPYIMKCMESALSQTFESIEFLVIDDKGTDNSMDIVRKLQDGHERGKDIRIVDNVENKGLSETRNVALREATGKYLFFLDSDDYISSDCIELLYNAITKENVEIAISSFQEVLEDGTVRSNFMLPYLAGREQDELSVLRYGKMSKDLLGTIWNVLFRMSFLKSNDLHFKARKICEDTLFWLDAYPLVQSFVMLPNITYFYLIRSNSLTFFNVRKVIPLNEVRERISIRTYAKKKLMEVKNKPYFEDMSVYVMHFSYNAAVSMTRNRKYIEPSLLLSDWSEALSMPLSLTDVLSQKRKKKELLLFYTISRLPSWYQKIILIIICRVHKG